MNDGLQILIDRMQTHPEEFDIASRWNREVDNFRNDFSAEDITAYDNALKATRQRLFTSRVMDKLLSEEREDREALRKVSVSGKVTLSSSQYDFMQDQLKDAVEAYKQEMRNGKKTK